MSSTYEDTLFDFDLNFLNNQSANVTAIQEKYDRQKQKKAISILKKKIISTDSLISKYYGKKVSWEEMEKTVVACKENSKQSLMKLNDLSKSYNQLQNEYETFKNQHSKCDETLLMAENKIEASNLYANQLQLLLKEKETISSRSENNVKKPSVKNNEIKLFERTIENLKKDIFLFIPLIKKLAEYTKRPLKPKYDLLLKSYETSRDGKKSNFGDYSDAEDEIFDDVLLSPPSDVNMAKKCSVSNKDIMVPMECDNDYSNEVVSIDTGRGSSLAFSDNEKCIHSPDYFLNDSPLNGENIVIKSRAKVVSIATSPIMFEVYESNSNFTTIYDSHSKSLNTIDISVSPINKTVSASTSPVKKITRDIATSTDKMNNTVSTSTIKKVTRETSTSTDKINTRFSASPVKKITRDIATNTNIANNTVPTSPILKVTRETATSTDEINTRFSASSEKKITRDIATNTDKINNSLATSPIKKATREIVSSTDELNNTISASLKKKRREIITCTDNDLDEITISNKVHTQDAQAKQCLELNNSNNLSLDNHTDNEIEMIFDKMKLNFKSVSPMPRTPSTMVSEHNEQAGACDDCKSAQKIIHWYYGVKDKFLSFEPLLHNNIMRHNNESTQIVNSEENLTDSLNLIPQDSIVNQNSNWNQMDVSESESEPILLPDDNNIAILDSNTENLKNTHDGNISSELSISRVQDQSPVQLVFVKETRDSKVSKNKNKVKHLNKSVVKKQSLTKESNTKKSKNKKRTKLDKLRNILKPKYKIRPETPPLVKSQMKPMQRTPEKKLTETDTSASLNDKNAYAKAVKIMAEINSQKCGVSQKSDEPINNVLSPKDKTQLEDSIDTSENDKLTSPKSLISTRSQKNYDEQFDACTVVLEKSPLINAALEMKNSGTLKRKNNETSNEPLQKRRGCPFESEVPCKRILRNSTINQRLSTEQKKNKKETANTVGDQYRKSIEAPKVDEIEVCDKKLRHVPKKVHDLQTQRRGMDASSEDIQSEKQTTCLDIQENTNPLASNPKESILVTMLTLYGTETVKPFTKKVADPNSKIIGEKIELEIAKVKALPLHERNIPLNRFIVDLQKMDYKCVINGIIVYLNKSERRIELFAKISGVYCPAMTDPEQILLYVIRGLYWPAVDFVGELLGGIEFVLFNLSRTPEFDIIESISHFYAVLCRYTSLGRSRLRMFVLDAMYCMQYKAIPLFKQCLEVCMQIIPLAHMGIARTPLVTCLVYLLHFYKCEDKYNRVQEIRNILSKKYFYKMSDWNERKILEVFKNAILDVNDNPIEKKMLRMALIILAKRQGPQWCQNHIIKNLLIPLIEKKNVSNIVKEFCVSMIGPLMKPYPVDMKVHCEIAFNQLANIVENKPSRSMEEAAIMSMIVINRHNQCSINQMLLKRKMIPMSSNLEETLRDYIRTRPLKMWKKMLLKIGLS